MYQRSPFKGPPEFTQIGIFDLKTNHLATLVLIIVCEKIANKIEKLIFVKINS
jgi:hypothetical protein